MRRLTVVLAIAAAVLTAAASASALAPHRTITITVHAALVGSRHDRLVITRNGTQVYDALVRSRGCGHHLQFCTYVGVSPGRSPIKVIDLRGSGQLDVILGLFTGGAHCCFVDQVFRYDAGRGIYVKSSHDFFDAGATIKRLDGRLVFMSANALVADGSPTDFADSGAPIQIWRFSSGGRFVDITRRYPSLIRRDAAGWLRAAHRHPRNNLGFLAAWAADQDMLGRSHHVAAVLAADAQAGRLHSPLGLPGNGTQADAVAAIQKLLRQLGYRR